MGKVSPFVSTTIRSHPNETPLLFFTTAKKKKIKERESKKKNNQHDTRHLSLLSPYTN